MKIPTTYDADTGPDMPAWRSMAGNDRIRAVMQFHMQGKIAMRHLKWHAVMHVSIENMLIPVQSPMHRALDRLRKEGLCRHDAIHAFAAVLLAYPVDALAGDLRLSARQKQLAFNHALEALTLEKCRAYVSQSKSVFSLSTPAIPCASPPP